LIWKNNIKAYHLILLKIGREEVKKNSWTCFNPSKDDIKPVSNSKIENISEGTLDTQLINSL